MRLGGLPAGYAVAPTSTPTPTPTPTPVALTSFDLTTPAPNGTYPFSTAVFFTLADAPSDVTTDLGTAQVVVKKRWNDGSVKHAIVSGRASLTQNVTRAVEVSTGSQASGTALTSANIQAANPVVTIQCGAVGTVSLTSLLASPFRTWISGPEMVECHYRAQVGSSNHLVAWFSVKLFADGRVQIFPWVENGYIFVAGAANSNLTYAVTVDGVSVFSQALNLKSHARAALVGSDGLGYWIGGDPQVTVLHGDGDYCQDTKLVPNYGWKSPSEASLAALGQTYTPAGIGVDHDISGTAGTRGDLMCREAAMYFNSADARALRCLRVNALMLGTYTLHYRDENTNEPMVLSSHAATSFQDSNIPVSATGGSQTFAVTHSPSIHYPAYLVTGEYFFLEEMLFNVTFNFMGSDTVRRYGAEGVMIPNNGGFTTRGSAWALRTLAQLLAVLPDDHTCYASLKTSWEQNMTRWKSWFVDGTLYSDQYVTNVTLANNLGQPSYYINYNNTTQSPRLGGTSLCVSPWQQSYVTLAVANAWDIEPTGTVLSEHQAVRDFLYKMPVGLAGDGAAGGRSYRLWDAYYVPVGSAPQSLNFDGPVTWYTSFAQMYAEEKAQVAAAASASEATGLSLLRHNDFSGDVVAGDWQGAYSGEKLPALAYAYEHGATGATAAWDRITGSTSWSLTDEFNDTPEFGIVPRGWTAASTTSWLSGIAVNEWVEILGTEPSNISCPTYTGQSVGNRVEFWSGSAYSENLKKIVFAAQGGHLNYLGNETVGLTVTDNAPAWTTLEAGSSSATLNGLTSLNGGTGSNTARYPDDKPASVHGYYSALGNSANDRVMRFCQTAISTSGFGKDVVEGFNLGTNAWDAAGTYPDVPGGPSGAGSQGVAPAQDANGNVYCLIGTTSLRKWTQATNTWSTVSAGPGVFPPLTGFETASAYDLTRDHIFYLQQGSVGLADLSVAGSVTWTSPTLTGTSAAAVLALLKGAGLCYDRSLDAYLVRGGASGTTVYKINASTFAVTTLTTTGDTPPATLDLFGATENVYTKFHYAHDVASGVGGVFYIPAFDENVFFLRTH